MAKDLTAALQALTEESAGQSSRVDKVLPSPTVAPPIPARTSAGAKKTGNGGIDGPLTEIDFMKRENYTAGWKSSDGIFTLPAIKKLVMTDASGREVVLNFAEPVAP